MHSLACQMGPEFMDIETGVKLVLFTSEDHVHFNISQVSQDSLKSPESLHELQLHLQKHLPDVSK